MSRKRKIILKSEDDLIEMRRACGVAATIKQTLAKNCTPGITTRELDQYGRELMEGMGCISAFYGYKGPGKTPPYPGYTCISVNEEVVHGIPGNRKIKLGDIVSIDVGVVYEGWVGDNATTVMVGVTDPNVIRLVEQAELALKRAISLAVEGNYLGDICHSIERVARKAGFGIVRDFVGHGVGRNMHEPPQIPNYGKPGTRPRLREGMTLAIEPMFNLGRDGVETMPDGWTIKTKDRLPSVHVEHTVAVKKSSAEILTVPENLVG